MDGIAKPNSDIDFDLYAKTNETDFELVKSQQAKEKVHLISLIQFI